MTDGVCITSGDQALPGRVVALLEDGIARVDLVHAKVAIGRLHEGS